MATHALNRLVHAVIEPRVADMRWMFARLHPDAHRYRSPHVLRGMARCALSLRRRLVVTDLAPSWCFEGQLPMAAGADVASQTGEVGVLSMRERIGLDCECVVECVGGRWLA